MKAMAEDMLSQRCNALTSRCRFKKRRTADNLYTYLPLCRNEPGIRDWVAIQSQVAGMEGFERWKGEDEADDLMTEQGFRQQWSFRLESPREMVMAGE